MEIKISGDCNTCLKRLICVKLQMALSLTKFSSMLAKTVAVRLHVCEPSTSAYKCAVTVARNLAVPALPVRPSSPAGYYVL